MLHLFSLFGGGLLGTCSNWDQPSLSQLANRTDDDWIVGAVARGEISLLGASFLRAEPVDFRTYYLELRFGLKFHLQRFLLSFRECGSQWTRMVWSMPDFPSRLDCDSLGWVGLAAGFYWPLNTGGATASPTQKEGDATGFFCFFSEWASSLVMDETKSRPEDSRAQTEGVPSCRGGEMANECVVEADPYTLMLMPNGCQVLTKMHLFKVVSPNAFEFCWTLIVYPRSPYFCGLDYRDWKYFVSEGLRNLMNVSSPRYFYFSPVPNRFFRIFLPLVIENCIYLDDILFLGKKSGLTCCAFLLVILDFIVYLQVYIQFQWVKHFSFPFSLKQDSTSDTRARKGFQRRGNEKERRWVTRTGNWWTLFELPRSVEVWCPGQNDSMGRRARLTARTAPNTTKEREKIRRKRSFLLFISLFLAATAITKTRNEQIQTSTERKGKTEMIYERKKRSLLF